MKIRHIVLIFFFACTFATYAQHNQTAKAESKSAVTEFKLESTNLKELKNFDWNTVKEMFEDNDANQEITIALAYQNKSKADKSKVSIDKFEVRVTGKTADIDKLTSKLKKSIEKLNEIDGKNIKN